MAEKKRKVTPQQRVKESQQAKKRRRQLKGSKKGGEFASSGIKKTDLSHIFKHSATNLAGMRRVEDFGGHDPDEEHGRREEDEEWWDRGVRHGGKKHDIKADYPGGGGSPKQTYRQAWEGKFNQLYRGQNRGHLSKEESNREAHQYAFDRTRLEHGTSPTIAQMRKEMEPVRVRRQTPEEEWGRGRGKPPSKGGQENEESYQRRVQDFEKQKKEGRISSEHLWRTHRGTLYGHQGGLPEGPPKHKAGKETPTQVTQRMSQDEQDWLESEFNKAGSPFYQAKGKGGDAGAKKRLRQYTDLRQGGYAGDESYQYVGNLNERRGRGRPSQVSEKEKGMQEGAAEDIQQRIHKRSTGRKDKYKSGAPSHEAFGFGIKVPGVDTADELKKRFPDYSEADIVRYRQAQRDQVEDWLAHNERMAHESRAAQLTGKTGASAEPSDRVVFLTTNIGSPAPSVSANSLLGQYIIKKRKKMVVDSKSSSRWEVKGEFPAAVRDRHLIEISTGLSLGAQGRYGVYQNTGWRRGNKRSKGYGKQIPVGTSVLRDANNQPVYDKDGNIVYTEGYTRPFDVGTRDAGLRIFIG